MPGTRITAAHHLRVVEAGLRPADPAVPGLFASASSGRRCRWSMARWNRGSPAETARPMYRAGRGRVRHLGFWARKRPCQLISPSGFCEREREKPKLLDSAEQSAFCLLQEGPKIVSLPQLPRLCHQFSRDFTFAAGCTRALSRKFSKRSRNGAPAAVRGRAAVPAGRRVGGAMRSPRCGRRARRCWRQLRLSDRQLLRYPAPASPSEVGAPLSRCFRAAGPQARRRLHAARHFLRRDPLHQQLCLPGALPGPDHARHDDGHSED